MDSVTAAVGAVVFNAGLAILVALYFIPTIVAVKRNANTGPVIVINVFLGWTLLGWVAALALAVAGTPSKVPFQSDGPGTMVGMDEQQALVTGAEMTIHHHS
jgi:hypothetical protein